MYKAEVLIVGGGHAGAQAAIALRHRKFEGSIVIVSAEDSLPYERPPLSKEYLSGEKTFDRLLIRPEAFWKDREVGFILGLRVISVDPLGHRVILSDGSVYHYEVLIWSAGGEPRRLTCVGSDLAGVHSVRKRGDVDRIVAELASTDRVAVVGGGYIGLEAAAVLVKLGKSVTLLETQDRVLARVSGQGLSRFVEAEHRSHGVDIRLNVAVKNILGEGAASGVSLSDGEVVAAEMVIVGIGIDPAVTPLLSAGAEGGNGVRVDEYCKTSLDDIFAIGDCALHSNSFADGQIIRLESIQNANDMAVTVAKAITGHQESYNVPPWFWSNQYDLRLQTIGLSSGHDTEIIRGDTTTRSFSVVYLKQGRVIALDCVNAARDYVEGKGLVVQGARLARDLLSDPNQSLKQLLAANRPLD